MARRRALIVDDSKTAQMRLRKMLERFDLDVDTSMSAEEALGYLTYRQPAVIFLDHHMEGMDGLEALKIIKSNPATALIPVIMYTSEQGDVYVGQARALGAIDIIGKEIIKQSDLKKVLASLGIGPRGQSEEAAAVAPAAGAVSSEADKPTVQFRAITDEPEQAAGVAPEVAPASMDASHLDQVQKQISRLFEIHITKVRQEIEDNTKFLFRRLTKEIQEKNKQNRAASAPVAPPPEPVYPPEPVERSGVPAIFAAVLLFAFVFLGFQLYSNSRDREVQREQIDQLLEQVRQNEATAASVLARLNGQPQAQGTATFADRQIMLDALSWAVNVNTQVDFGQQALDDQRIYMLGEMLGLLKAANFAGVVYLDVHMGNYCVVEDPSGRLILPEPESNLEDCRFMADRQPEVPLSDQVSVGFLNYLQSAPILTEGNIDVEMSSQSYSTPRFSYPPTTGAVSAGEWNAVAQKNNRIAVSFSSN